MFPQTPEQTPEQNQLQQQAIAAAKLLVYGNENAAVPSSDQSYFNFVASRQEHKLNKAAAKKRWGKSTRGRRLSEIKAKEEEMEITALLTTSAIENADKREDPWPRETHINEIGTGSPRQFQKSEKLPATFNPQTGCVVQIGAILHGENIAYGYNRSITHWSDCCERCYQRRDCAAWTVIAHGESKGCHLKAKLGPKKGQGKEGDACGVVSTAYPRPSSPRPPPSRRSPSPLPTQVPNKNPSLSKSQYGKVLGMSWMFYEAQRSGYTPRWNSVPWRTDSHLTDTVIGGWYDAGDYLKLSFPLAPTVGMLAWGLIEFQQAYSSAGKLKLARNNLRHAADFLHRCWDPVSRTFVAQIGDPDIDHKFWGRAEEQNVKRPTLYYNESMPAADLYGAVAGALAATSIAFDRVEEGWAKQILSTAEILYSWGAKSGGKYDTFYPHLTGSIYPSTDNRDSLAWAAGWLWRATKNATYLQAAHVHWNKGEPDVYPGWDSLWAGHAVHMVTIAAKGSAVPGLQDYTEFAKNTFLRSWIDANGTQDLIKTPRGLHYPSWNQWANLAYSTQAAALALLHAKYEKDPVAKAEQLAFGRSQVDYALGVTSLRSYVVGYGPSYPTSPHHPSASCPNKPQPCGKEALESKEPNPQVLTGALVGGPAGVRRNKSDPDDSYRDRRTDYVTNEAANDYNAGFTTALVALYALG